MKKLTLADFISRASKVHDNKYDYSETLYERSDKKVKVICPIHGAFYPTPQDHYSGSECRKCFQIRQAQTWVQENAKDFKVKIEKLYGDKYDLSETVYTGVINKAEIICKQHGKFEVLVSQFLQGWTGCQGCIANNKKQAGINKRKGAMYPCLICGDMFWRYPSWIKENSHLCCKKKCANQYMQQNHADTSRKNLDIARQFVDYTKRRGSGSPNWKGDSYEKRDARNSFEYKAWRLDILKNNDYTCQFPNCGKRGGKLFVDHYPYPFHKYPEYRTDPNNGRTLCEYHNYYVTHVTRE